MTEADVLDLDPSLPSRQLAAMRWVWDHGPREDRNEGDRQARKLMEENREKFGRLMAHLEKEYREGLKGIPKTVEDAGPDDVVGLLTRLLEEKPWLPK